MLSPEQVTLTQSCPCLVLAPGFVPEGAAAPLTRHYFGRRCQLQTASQILTGIRSTQSLEAKCQAQPSLSPPRHDRSWWPGRSDQQALNQLPRHFGVLNFTGLHLPRSFVIYCPTGRFWGGKQGCSEHSLRAGGPSLATGSQQLSATKFHPLSTAQQDTKVALATQSTAPGF